MRSFLMALVAASMLPSLAYADDWAPSELDPCVGCKKKHPAPVPDPVPAVPNQNPPELVNPVTPPAPAPTTVVVNYPEDKSSSPGFVRGGISGALTPGLWTMPAEVIDASSHPSLTGFDGTVGGYVGFGGNKEGAGYFDLHAAYGRGGVGSQLLSTGALVGYTLQFDDHLAIVGLTVDGGIRDYDVVMGQYTARRIGAVGGPEMLVELDNNKSAFDASLVGALLVGGGETRQVITGQVMPGLEMGAKIELRIGLQGPR